MQQDIRKCPILTPYTYIVQIDIAKSGKTFRRKLALSLFTTNQFIDIVQYHVHQENVAPKTCLCPCAKMDNNVVHCIAKLNLHWLSLVRSTISERPTFAYPLKNHRLPGKMAT